MRDCNSVPKLFEEGGVQCNLDMDSNKTDNTTCINWNQYYTNCSDSTINPFKGAINFDNIFYAWIAIFQVTVYSHQEGRTEGIAKWTIPQSRHRNACGMADMGSSGNKDCEIAFVHVSAKQGLRD